MEWERIEMPRPLQVSGPEFVGRPGVNQNYVVAPSIALKPRRIDQKLIIDKSDL